MRSSFPISRMQQRENSPDFDDSRTSRLFLTCIATTKVMFYQENIANMSTRQERKHSEQGCGIVPVSFN